MRSLLLGRPLRNPKLARHLLTHKKCLSTESSFRDKPQYHSEHPQPPKFSPQGLNPSPSQDEIQPGDHVLAVCRQYHIGFPNSLRRFTDFKLRSNQCKLFVTASDRHCFDLYSMKYLDKYEHPFAKTVLDMYIARTETPLWFKATYVPNAKPFPCQTATSRIRHAFRDALAALGYDREGRKVSVDGSDPIVDMYGTVKILCADPKAACNIKFDTLREQVTTIVAGIERVLGRNKYGKHITGWRKPQVQKSLWKQYDNKQKKKPTGNNNR